MTMYIGVKEAKERQIKKFFIAGDSLVTLQAVNEPNSTSDWTLQYNSRHQELIAVLSKLSNQKNL